ncbi:hypothetical protein OSB04_014742 [Centaurea solstitialis]|uniref:Uncharacterized protein n=1 Tax=Centaurea solstitialis TaxID=347529 RepID=A0AA38W8A1_9ASTR|nr:hypothetical protein OSB04_014742 [Centaurea solstitialis]
MYRDLDTDYWCSRVKQVMAVVVRGVARHVYEDMSTRLQFSTVFHPWLDGQSERTIQTLEVMLRENVLDFGGSRDTYLPLAEFSCNNSFHAYIGMAPYEMSYGRRWVMLK